MSVVGGAENQSGCGKIVVVYGKYSEMKLSIECFIYALGHRTVVSYILYFNNFPCTFMLNNAM